MNQVICLLYDFRIDVAFMSQIICYLALPPEVIGFYRFMTTVNSHFHARVAISQLFLISVFSSLSSVISPFLLIPVVLCSVHWSPLQLATHSATHSAITVHYALCSE